MISHIHSRIILTLLFSLLVFDHDGNGSITMSEFLSRDGLCDTLVAQMNPHFNELDAPDEVEQYQHQHRPQSYASPPSYHSQHSTGPPPAYYNPPSISQYPSPSYSQSSQSTIQIRCGHCGNYQQTTLPSHGIRTFLVNCYICRAQNQVNI